MLLSEQLQFNSMYLGQLIYLNISRITWYSFRIHCSTLELMKSYNHIKHYQSGFE